MFWYEGSLMSDRVSLPPSESKWTPRGVGLLLGVDPEIPTVLTSSTLSPDPQRPTSLRDGTTPVSAHVKERVVRDQETGRTGVQHDLGDLWVSLSHHYCRQGSV